MTNKLRAALFSARNLFITVFLWVFIFGVFNEAISYDLFLNAALFALFLAVIGLIFSVVLLIPLEKTVLKFSGTKSFLIFLLTGFLVPLSIMLSLNILNNWFFSYEETKVTNGILIYGTLGGITAASAWWYLTNRWQKRNEN